MDSSCSFALASEPQDLVSICLPHRTMTLHIISFTFGCGAKELRSRGVECVLHDYNNYIAKSNFIYHHDGLGPKYIHGC
jgi:hypothetical protein